MKHKLKPLIALIGTVLLGTHSIVLAEPNTAQTRTIRAQNNSGIISFSLERYQVDEGNPFGATITVDRNDCNSDSPPVSVKYATSNDTATASDYNAVSGTLTWSPTDVNGNCSPRDFSIQIIEDTQVEGNEIINLQLSNPTGGAELGQSHAIVTLVDNDSSVITFSQDNYRVNEDDQSATITIERTDCVEGTISSVTIAYESSRIGTATEGTDYDGLSGGLKLGGRFHWEENECGPKTFEVPILDDSEVEGDEIVTMKITSVMRASLGQNSEAVLTIVDNDSSTLGFSHEFYNVSENEPLATISVERTNCIEGFISSASVRYSANLNFGTASSEEDFEKSVLLPKVLNWEEGDCDPKTLELSLIDDSDLEGDETIHLNLDLASGATLSQNAAVLTITDDDSVQNQEGTSLGTAIVIAGIARPKDTLFTYSNEYVQRMYSLLKERGFTDEDIYYMNPQPPDLDGDGYLETELQDYQLIDPAKELDKAFEQAASHLQAGQQFVFYWHGHALPDYFRLKQDYELPAEQLSQLLEKIPTGVKQVIILDSCYSGSFIDELKGVANRIILTSADASNKAWEIQYDSFSNKLIRELRRGETVGNAFLSAREMITSQPQWFGNQDPWLDDDGDGLYTVSGDGRYAARTYLGRKGLHAAQPPEIVQIHPSISLTGETASATLWVKVIPNRAEAINQVRAVLIRPNWQFGEYQGSTTHFGRTELELRYNSAQERYENKYDYFCTAGQWRILYQVQSKDGIWSDVQFGEVQQAPDIQASTCLTPMTVKMGLNQTRYTTGDTLLLDMTINGTGDADLYVAIIFPDGNFMTLGYPDEFGFPNTPQPYIAAVNIAGEKIYPIFNLLIPQGLALGNYSTCGVLVPPNTDDVLDQSNWIHLDCPGFEMY
jgi:hypothetical protein